MWAVQMNVVCDSEETARAYAERLHDLLKLRQLPLPEGYLFTEIAVGEGEFEPVLTPDIVSLIPGGEDG